MAGLKIAVSGKGGVGKSTISSQLALYLGKEGSKVLAVDCDPNTSLGTYLGVKEDIRPVIDMTSLIEERMETKLENYGAFFKLNPKVDDIPDKYSKTIGNIKVIAMGTVKKGGKGCACPENTFIKSLVGHLILGRNEIVVMDMEAGLEHFGRGTASGVDVLLIVVEPSIASIETAEKIKKLAQDIKIKKVFIIANKLRDLKDKNKISEKFNKGEVIGGFYLEDGVQNDAFNGIFPVKLGQKNAKELERIAGFICQLQ